ncbi:MAG TPA: HupE/UreJ family protein [Vulgatibacter sp.]
MIHRLFEESERTKEPRARRRVLVLLPPPGRPPRTLASAFALLIAAPLTALAHDPTAQVVALEAEEPGFLQWVGLGVEHILTGWDHLLFLVAIGIVATRLGELAGAITSFTVAHSITLGLAASGLVSIPAAVVEPAIAASIVLVAVENVVRRDPLRGRAALTFGFGLVHGFGFASVLAEEGIAGSDFAPALAGFNIGVEVGQLSLVALAILPVAMARRTGWFDRLAIPVASAAVGSFGAYWLVERLAGGV